MEEPHAGAFERMKEVLEAGMELSPHPAVEKALGEISGLLSQVIKLVSKWMLADWYARNNLKRHCSIYNVYYY